ncbi:oxidoreductase [Agrobacterium bohemicum]|uniref:Oxidoreductase n=1 Tax=Agrobacterium bohemicum TaxID=2052828 RepID=A0A135P1T1_9HYPH|nr:oxidoreductase [Agrobacterium bohemicum]KXG85384.1 oxidoreductase [Agrobacterium bohemicum]
MGIVRLVLSAVLAICFFSYAQADALPQPTGKPILTISGNISNTNADAAAKFDRDMLEAVGLVTIETHSPWYDGLTRFEGVSLKKLMDFVGAKGTTVTAVALNDYVSTIPMADFDKFNVILAMKRDGNYMEVREKGPLFVIYPYDTASELQTQTYYTRSAWQVAKLIVE